MNRRTRRIVAWAVITPLALGVAAYAVKIVGMYRLADDAISSYWAVDYPGTIDAARGLELLNLFEPYKAPFNSGVGYAASGAFDEARVRFEEALELATGVEACPVLVNLALTIERQGDDASADAEWLRAYDLYAEAAAVAGGAPAECASESAREQSPDPRRSMSDALDEARERASEKAQEAQENAAQEQDGAGAGGDRGDADGQDGSGGQTGSGGQQGPGGQQGADDEQEPDGEQGPGGQQGGDGASGSSGRSGTDGDDDRGGTGGADGSQGDGGDTAQGDGTSGPSDESLERLRERMDESAGERSRELSNGRYGGGMSSDRAERPW
ncbi:hypothetical protein [Microbacterium sp. No. 7]|uniref:hypothetical protein n=1 Tax=Microbacterium sp. No. 7 TaxID=1714373 RepID=UPI0006D0ABFD|nr:hypothetical protein [Microbacterium sp. No. 7]